MTADDLPADLEALVESIRRRAGLVIPQIRHADVARAVARLRQERGIGDRLTPNWEGRVHSNILDQLIAEFTIGETYFFRDLPQFEHLRNSVIPELTRRRSERHTFRVLSAGCSSGEEAYSLAIEFAEAGLRERTRVLATDIALKQLERANRAVFGNWSLRGPGADRMQPYLRPEGSRYRLDHRIRQQVTFFQLNLVGNGVEWDTPQLREVDLVFCRNVLIYFDQQAIKLAAQRLYDCLAPGGVLVVGPSDPLLVGLAPFEVLHTESGLLYRRPESNALHPLTAAPQADAAHLARPPASSQLTIENPSQLEPPVVNATEEARLRQGLVDSTFSDAQSSYRGVQASDLSLEEIKVMANRGSVGPALGKLQEMLARQPLNLEAGIMMALLQLRINELDGAERTLKRLLYFDRGQIVLHWIMALVLAKTNRHGEAIRSLERVRAMAGAMPPERPVEFGEGQTAFNFLRSVDMQLRWLKDGDSRNIG